MNSWFDSPRWGSIQGPGRLVFGLLFLARSAVEFTQGNAETLPFADESFDRVMCTMSFHRYLNPSKAVSEIARTLKCTGEVRIVDPTADNFIMRLADARIRRREPDHVKMYSSGEFQELFEAAGLRYGGSGRIMVLWFTAKAHFAERPAS